MNGPLPGMDPWLETCYRDFHTRFLTYLSDIIKPLLPSDLRIRIESEVVLEPVVDEVCKRLRPDAGLHVAEGRAVYELAGAVATVPDAVADAPADVEVDPIATPTRVLHHVPAHQRSLRITHAGEGGRLVTAVELLSPTNKRQGEGLRAYRRKQRAMLEAGVNLLELDFVRGGGNTTVAASEGLASEHPAPHHVSLANFCADGDTEYYAIALADRLPRIRLPLRAEDEPIGVSLQAALEEAMLRGDYARDFDYAADPPCPPLTPEERAWIDGRVEAWRAASAPAPAAVSPGSA